MGCILTGGKWEGCHEKHHFFKPKGGGLLGFHLLSLLTRSSDAEAPLGLYGDCVQVWLVLDEHDIAI